MGKLEKTTNLELHLVTVTITSITVLWKSIVKLTLGLFHIFQTTADCEDQSNIWQQVEKEKKKKNSLD